MNLLRVSFLQLIHQDQDVLILQFQMKMELEFYIESIIADIRFRMLKIPSTTISRQETIGVQRSMLAIPPKDVWEIIHSVPDIQLT